MRRERVVRQVCEPVVGGADHVHLTLLVVGVDGHWRDISARASAAAVPAAGTVTSWISTSCKVPLKANGAV